MTKYFKKLLKGYFLNPALVFWGILFILFWEVMAVYVFAKDVAEEYMIYAIASFYGQLLIIGLGSIASGLISYYYSASFSVRYVTKFSKLNPRKFFVEHFSATITYLLAYSIIIWGLLVGLAFVKNNEWYLPENPFGLAFATIIIAIFMYLFTMFMSYIIIFIRKPKYSNFIGFLPLMLSFISYAAFWVDFGGLAYIIPFNLISNATYYYYTDTKPFTGDIIGNMIKIAMHEEPSYADPTLTIFALVLWCLILIALNYILIRKAKGISYEESRLL